MPKVTESPAALTDLPEGVVIHRVRRKFGDVTVLDGVDLLIPRGRRLGIVGPSGCGKSTLLSLVAGLDEADDGYVAIHGATDAKARLRRSVLMLQTDALLPWRTALDNACLGLENRGMSRNDARERARPLFDRFGLSRFERHRPSQLSGGMRQRVAFMRTLLAEKDILLLDEPFGALDAITRAQLQDWLSEALATEPRTVLLVTHDVDEALLLSDTVVVLSARPARVLVSLHSHFPRLESRRRTITSDAFISLKDRALEALER